MEIEDEIDAEEAARRVEAGAYLLDVREAEEWSAGHVATAHHLPLHELPTAFASLPEDRQIVVVCRVGGRSAQATAFLREGGRDAVNLRGGMFAWADAGFPFVSNDGSQGSVV